MNEYILKALCGSKLKVLRSVVPTECKRQNASVMQRRRNGDCLNETLMELKQKCTSYDEITILIRNIKSSLLCKGNCFQREVIFPYICEKCWGQFCFCETVRGFFFPF